MSGRPGPRVHGRPDGASPPAAGRAVVRGLPFEGDEVALVQAMREGRADAASAFYDRHVRAVHALAFRLMGPDADLDDVVHDVFVRALEALPRLREPRALRSWLLGIAVRTVRIRFQRRGRQRWLRFFAPEDVPEVAFTPRAGIGEALGEVYAILGGMDPDERIAFVLVRVEGMSLEEAATTAGTSLATLRRRLSRAQLKFFTRAGKRPALDEWLQAEAP